MLLFTSCLPQSLALYRILWSEPCSDAFFLTFEYAYTWIACQNALEGASAAGLGYIDYRAIAGTDKQLRYAMRKKRLAFAKFAFMMATLGLILLDTPSPNCVVPLIRASGYNVMKLGTQISYNLTPDKFFIARTFISMYNLGFLVLVWFKCRQARKEKQDLEFNFYTRIEGIMLRMSELFEDQNFQGLPKPAMEWKPTSDKSFLDI